MGCFLHELFKCLSVRPCPCVCCPSLLRANGLLRTRTCLYAILACLTYFVSVHFIGATVCVHSSDCRKRLAGVCLVLSLSAMLRERICSSRSCTPLQQRSRTPLQRRRSTKFGNVIGAPYGGSKRECARREQILSESSPTGRRSKRPRQSSNSAKEYGSPGTASRNDAPPSPLSTYAGQWICHAL